MTDPVFATLEDVPLRDAWAHEAHRFTPWLAANLSRLSEAIGIPLELTGTEVKVGAFSADILARNAIDDSVVLIENQLESSDHTHLGQIMTYLAGLETHTMVWVAPTFREEHLSAIRWLNEHTVDPFAFFAVKVRVVRISDSPFAPLFEVIERPNNWDRNVASARREAQAGLSEIGQFRKDFWTRFCALYPEEGEAGGSSSRWHDLSGTDAKLAQYVSHEGVGVFIRPDRGGDAEQTRDELLPFADALEARLGQPLGAGRFLLSSKLRADARDPANRDRLCHWLHEQTALYRAAFEEIFGVKP